MFNPTSPLFLAAIIGVVIIVAIMLTVLTRPAKYASIAPVDDESDLDACDEDELIDCALDQMVPGEHPSDVLRTCSEIPCDCAVALEQFAMQRDILRTQEESNAGALTAKLIASGIEGEYALAIAERTYGDIDAMADRIATALIDQGVLDTGAKLTIHAEIDFDVAPAEGTSTIETPPLDATTTIEPTPRMRSVSRVPAETKPRTPKTAVKKRTRTVHKVSKPVVVDDARAAVLPKAKPATKPAAAPEKIERAASKKAKSAPKKGVTKRAARGK